MPTGNRRHTRAVIGTLLYQMAYLMSVPVANALLIPELAELLRMIITNSVILFARPPSIENHGTVFSEAR